MYPQKMLDAVPLWLLFVGLLALFTLALVAGSEIGRRWASSGGEAFAKHVEGMTASLFGLAGFLLVITFQISSARFEDRRRLLVEEANAIGTTYLRARFLPESDRYPVRQLLREYVDQRLALGQGANFEEALAKSSSIQRRLWEHAVSASDHTAKPLFVSLFVQSLNEMIDLQTTRVTIATVLRIKPAMWGTFYVVVVASMILFGYTSGVRKVRSVLAAEAFVVALVAVLTLITAMDRADSRLFHLNPQVMIDLRGSMTAP